jgi:thiosulfate reductase cytochrome b subunit
MRTLKYIGRLLGEFFDFAWQNKAWWIIPIVLVLLVLAGLIVTGSSVAPFIYTLF